MRPLRRALGLRRATARLRLALLYGGVLLFIGTILVAILFGFGSSASSVVAHAHVRFSGGHETTFAVPEIVHQQHVADVNRLLSASLVVLALTAVAASVVGWLLAGRVLRPLAQMTATARNISAHNLSERLAIEGPDDEVKRLGDTLDDLLARLETSFEAQRRFVANASHELRTPLTVDRTLLQVALADPNASVAQLRAICEELLASGREQERTLEALLTLASSERGLDQHEPFDLALIAGRLADAAGAATVSTSLAPAPTSGDPALVERLIANLLDNALRHNDERGLVEVSTGSEAGEAFITVSNTGPVLTAASLSRLFEPFQRAGERPVGPGGSHHGLGLSIVRAIASAHDARVETRAREEGGLIVTVRFPRRPE
jgi:signal transduction histidine kinase